MEAARKTLLAEADRLAITIETLGSAAEEARLLLERVYRRLAQLRDRRGEIMEALILLGD